MFYPVEEWRIGLEFDERIPLPVLRHFSSRRAPAAMKLGLPSQAGITCRSLSIFPGIIQRMALRRLES